MTHSLNRRAAEGVAQFQVALALLIFLPAWSIGWWQAWTAWGVMGAALSAITLWLARTNPALLAARLAAGPGAEVRPAQRRIQTVTAALIVAQVAGSALGWRLGWTVPGWLSLLADGVMLASLGGVAWVFAVNGAAHAAVQVQAGQRLVTTGPYALVRHPMYGFALALLLALPLALGSWPAVALGLALGAMMAIRARDEEALLLTELPGYAAYRTRCRWRMVPGLY